MTIQLISRFSDHYLETVNPQIKRYEIKEKSDLRIEILPTGNKVWRKRFRINGKLKTITLGKYPDNTIYWLVNGIAMVECWIGINEQ